VPKQKPHLESKVTHWLKTLGPGVITGASDDDPSGIATYSQAGAQGGYGFLWTIIFSFPMMVAIQLVSAHIGRVTGRGIAANLKLHYSKAIMYGIVFLMVAANIVNIGADIDAMGAAVKLVAGGDRAVWAILLMIVSLVLQVFIPYKKYVTILKWLCIVLFAYVAVVFSINVPWGDALQHAVIPSLTLSSAYLTTIIAVLGTTISPYLFFWQASEEVEDERDDPKAHALVDTPRQARKQFSRMRMDTVVGMAFSNLIAFFIMLSAAVTLHQHGVTDITSASQAAEALRPIAGDLTFALFAIGIVGTGLLALPVLAGSAAYALGEVYSMTIGLNKKPREAKGFYALIVGVTVAGMLVLVVGVNPIHALYWAAVINGIVAVPIMVLMMLMGSNRTVMSKLTLSPRLRFGGWFSTLVMFVAAVGLLLTL
jgi:NRAMP (natural resistance-associated macrophage protein)-like metal ion transporter